MSKIRDACCKKRKWGQGNQDKTVYTDVGKIMKNVQ